MYNSHNPFFTVNTYLLPPGGLDPRRSAARSLHHRPPSLRSKAHTDRGIRTPTSADPPLSTTSSPAAAPPTAGTPPATGSTTAAGRSTVGHSARSGTASRSPPRGTSRTPSATATASRHGAPAACRGSSGNSSAAHAFRVHASERHHHVRPVAHQVVHRCRQGVHAPLELRDQILLVTTIVRTPSGRPASRDRWW